LNAPEEYRDIWWSWHGLGTRADTTAGFSTRAALAVNSLNAQQAADLARIVAEGRTRAGHRLGCRGIAGAARRSVDRRQIIAVKASCRVSVA
jgi:hypothetical protein